MSGPHEPIRIDVVRDGVVESVHQLDAVVVDRSGRVVVHRGDARRVAYFRSSLKPIQTAVCIAEGWQPGDDAAIAVACASHNAEPDHLAVVRAVLAAAGLDEAALRCPPALPMHVGEAARAGRPARIFRDCSGKHAAFLATCVARGWPLESYLEASHPLQAAILDRTRALAGTILAIGVDGCGAPTPAASLLDIAHAFGRGIEQASDVHRAMRAHPFLVAGSDRIDTAVMQNVDGDVVLKGGAEGLMCFASPAAGIAGAVKCRDGSARAIAPATIALLVRAGVISPEAVDSLAGFAEPPVFGGGAPRGTLHVHERDDLSE